jgi:hypothetical protein
MYGIRILYIFKHLTINANFSFYVGNFCLISPSVPVASMASQGEAQGGALVVVVACLYVCFYRGLLKQLELLSKSLFNNSLKTES